MPYCSRCGVEVDRAVETCPLCAAPIQKLDGEEAPGKEAPPAGSLPGKRYPLSALDREMVQQMNPRQRSMLAWEIASVSIAIAVGVLLIIDALEAGAIAWAYFPTVSLAAIWIGYSLVLLLGKRPLALFPLLALDLAAFLLALDLFDWRIQWYLNLALPMTGVLVVSVSAAAALIRFSKKRGLNVVAYVLLGITILSFGIDTVIQLNYGSFFKGSWSLIVSMALLPVVAFLIYLHYRLTKDVSLRKVFHR